MVREVHSERLMHYSYPKRKQLRKVGVNLYDRETWTSYYTADSGVYPHTQGHLFNQSKSFASVHKERKVFQWFYGLRAGTVVNLASKPLGLGVFETRLDTILHRSGLLPSLPMVRRAIREGHVSMSHRGVVTPCDYPGATVQLGARIVVELEYFFSVAAFRESSYEVPAYLDVDHSLGTVLRDRLPREGEILYPEVMSAPIMEIRAGYGK
jgi:ribosomal protein S4